MCYNVSRVKTAMVQTRYSCHHWHTRNRKLQTSKAPLKSQAQGTSLFTSAASNQRGFPKNSPWEAQVRFPEGARMRQIRGVFQRIVRGTMMHLCITQCKYTGRPCIYGVQWRS